MSFSNFMSSSSSNGRNKSNSGFGNSSSSGYNNNNTNNNNGFSSSSSSSMSNWWKSKQKSFVASSSSSSSKDNKNVHYHNHKNGSSSNGNSGPVGTEAVALEELARNRKQFEYPEEGFATPIEYSLIYSMIKEGPKTYPASLVVQQIQEEDFREYIYVKEKGRRNAKTSSCDIKERKVSYAQLSAILALSSVRWPPEIPDKNNKNTTKPETHELPAPSATSYSDDQNKPPSSSSHRHPKPPLDSNVSQALCKYLLKCVIRHAERHELDRNAEVQEFLHPVQVYSAQRENKAALQQVLPMYLGYAASLALGNPVPILMGISVSITADDKHANERENVEVFASETNRKADVETAGLLDEGEDMYDSD